MFFILPSSLIIVIYTLRRKRQQIANVVNVAIRNDTVSSIDSAAGVLVSHLQEIDLQDNLLWNWTEVCGILLCTVQHNSILIFPQVATLGSAVPNLSVLLLHNNKMQPLVPSLCEAFPR